MTDWNMRTEELELKDGNTIKNYHYEFNSTDRVLAKIVEDVFKGIMDIITDRKTEPRIKTTDYCDICNHKGCDNCVADSRDDYCVPSNYEPQIDDFFREPTAEERKAVAEYIESISIPTGVNVFDLMDKPQIDNSIGCSRCGSRYDCYDKDMPHTVH